MGNVNGAIVVVRYRPRSGSAMCFYDEASSWSGYYYNIFHRHGSSLGFSTVLTYPKNTG